MDELGVDSIEAGMPITSKETAAGIKAIVDMGLRADIVAFCRTKREDIEKAVECGVRTVILEHSVNPYICKYAYGLTEEKLHQRILSALKIAKENGLQVRFMGWDTFRCSEAYLKNLYQALAAGGVDGIVMVDTFSIATPMAVEYLVGKAKTWVPNVDLEFHVHNDMSMANASSLAAVKAGAVRVHSAINALGDRTGNLATEELSVAFELLMGIHTGINLEKLAETCKLLSDITRYPIPANKVVTGKNAILVEAGAVSHFMEKMKEVGLELANLPYMPPVVGRQHQPYLLGSSSGSVSIQYYLDKNGISVTPEQADAILRNVKANSAMTKLCLTEQEFLSIVKKVVN